MEKIKMALYWGATCGGCEVAVLDLNEKILDVVAIADIVLWPVAMDFKYSDVEAMEDGSIAVTLYNGAVRNEENEHIAKLLRQKSQVMIAFGSCACFGGIPGLGNVANRRQIFEVAYRETPSTVNPEFVTPQTSHQTDGKELTLPEFYDTVHALHQVVDVDYYVPGCPPAVERIADAVGIIARFVETGELPPKGAVVASDSQLCEECPRETEDKKISKVYRPHEIIPDPERCLLEQGILCMGLATRGGCGARCINANMPCRGCMGPTAAVMDHGAAVLSAIASILGVDEETQLSEEELNNLLQGVKDPLGTFYRFTLPSATIPRVIIKEEG